MTPTPIPKAAQEAMPEVLADARLTIETAAKFLRNIHRATRADIAYAAAECDKAVARIDAAMAKEQ